MAKKNKLLSSGIAVVSAAAVLFGGTFAWQSISQTALNEISASVNPGGRLHDDFNDITYNEDGTRAFDVMTYNKDVYVENFTELANNGVQVFARIRLDEYMELGAHAGELNEDGTKADKNIAAPLVPGTDLTDKSHWSTYKYGEDSAYRSYWEMSFSGKTVYMPTFNKNKDSLEADINGSTAVNFTDHVDYEAGDVSGARDNKIYAIYDVDAAEEGSKETDELAAAGVLADTVIQKGANALTDVPEWEKHVEVRQESHTARETMESTVISMEEWKALGAEEKTGSFWVYDTDGWAYWASPIDPETATGLLLTGINRTEAIINQDWYYAINVVAQFVTGDDLGQDDASGFYDLTEGSAPTAEALQLLNTIGVDVKFEVSTEEELAAALTRGGTIKLTDNVSISAPLTVSADTVIDFGDFTLQAAADAAIDGGTKETSALLYVDGATVIINSGNFKANPNDSFAVTVGNGGKVVIYGGSFAGNISAVYVFEGEAAIYGGTFSIQQTAPNAERAYNYLLNCYDANYANGTAGITVCGGTFENFDPANVIENDGTADVTVSYVPGGYSCVGSDGVYTVSKSVGA